MNEESRKNEINENELEEVTGGVERPMKRDGVCSVCGCSAYNRVIDGKTYLVCSVCGHKE